MSKLEILLEGLRGRVGFKPDDSNDSKLFNVLFKNFSDSAKKEGFVKQSDGGYAPKNGVYFPGTAWQRTAKAVVVAAKQMGLYSNESGVRYMGKGEMEPGGSILIYGFVRPSEDEKTMKRWLLPGASEKDIEVVKKTLPEDVFARRYIAVFYMDGNAIYLKSAKDKSVRANYGIDALERKAVKNPGAAIKTISQDDYRF